MSIVATQQEAAELLGVTARQFRNWIKEPWFPANGKTAKGFDTVAIQAARDAEGRKGSESSERRNRIRDDFAAERLKRERFRTRREELRIEEEEGRLIPRQSVEVFASSLLTEFGDWCDTLPGFVARLVPAKARKRVRDNLTAELDRRRRLLSDTLRAKAREFDESQPGGEPSA